MTGTDAERCYECGRPVGREDATCPACGANQAAICEDCGATHSVYSEVCPSCGLEVEPYRYRPKFTPLRGLFLLLLVLAVAGGVYAWLTLRKNPDRERRTAFVRASASYDKGEYGTAQVAFRQWIGRYGEHPRALEMVALSLWQAGRTEEAVEVARRAADLDPAGEVANVFLAGRALERGDDGEALARAERALAGGTELPDAHLIAGIVLSRPERLDLAGAVRHLRAAVRGGKSDPAILVRLADLAALKSQAYPGSESGTEIAGFIRKARETLGRRLAAEPTNAALLTEAARLDERLGDTAGAMANLGLAIRHGGETTDRQVLLAKLEHVRMNEEGARTVVDGLLAGEPGVDALLEIARFMDEAGDVGRATRALDLARGRYPGDPVVRIERIRRALRRAEPAAALAEARDAFRVLPDAPDIVVLLSTVLRRNGDLAAAEALLRDAAGRARPGSVVALHLADVLVDSGKLDEAESLLDAACAAGHPDDALGLFRGFLRGKLLLGRGRLGGAVDFLSEAVSCLPKDALAHFLLSQAHAIRGEHDLAALVLGGIHVEAWVRATAPLLVLRGRSLLATGAAEKAAEDAAAALALDPGREDASLLLAVARPAVAAEVLARSLEGPGSRVLTLVALGRLDEAEAKATTAAERIAVGEARAGLPGADAGAVFAALAAAFPDDPRIRLHVAVRALDAGRPEAEAEARAALRADPESVPAREALFECLFDERGVRDGAREEAERLAREVAERAPRGPSARYLSGKLRLADGDLPGALDDLAGAAADRPDRPRYRYACGAALLLLGDAPGARRMLAGAGAPGEALLRTPPGSLGMDLARTLLARDPSSPAARAVLRRALAVLPGASDRAGAARMLLDVARTAGTPAAPEPGAGTPRDLALADALFRAVADLRGDLPPRDAADLGREILALAPDHADALELLGSLLLDAGDGAGALAVLDRAVAAREAAGPGSRPALARALVRRALVHARANRRPEADRDLAAAADLDPSVREGEDYRIAARSTR